MKRWLVILILIAGLAGLINGFQLTGAGRADAFIGPNPAVIPQESLRLRIIANSNSVVDQNLKRAIRDQVIALVGSRMASVTSLAQAKAVLRAAVPTVERMVLRLERRAGVRYGAATAFAPAAFPTKLYGNRVYPAGTYLALRITLGRGAGANWWCVLFPALCFVALTDGDAVAATKAFPDYPPLAVTTITEPGNKRVPVALRLAVVDYGEEFFKIVGAEVGRVWRQIVLAV